MINVTNPPHYTKEEIVQRGKAWYERDIRGKVDTPENKGNAVVIDIETGAYEMDADGNVALQRALAKRPDGLVYRVRIGYKAYAKMGGSWKDSEE